MSLWTWTSDLSRMVPPPSPHLPGEGEIKSDVRVHTDMGWGGRKLFHSNLKSKYTLAFSGGVGRGVKPTPSNLKSKPILKFLLFLAIGLQS